MPKDPEWIKAWFQMARAMADLSKEDVLENRDHIHEILKRFGVIESNLLRKEEEDDG